MKRIFIPGLTILFLVGGAIFSLTNAYAVPLTLKSGINNNVYTVEGAPGTAGTKGVDYDIGTYLAGGDGAKGHGFKNQYNFHLGHYCSAAETTCFVSGPPAFTNAGGLEGPDNNWLQGTSHPIIVDLGAGKQSDQAIVFNSIDHKGSGSTYADPEKEFWNVFVEGIEFTVYGSNNLTDALACAAVPNGFGTAEGGTVPALGACSTFEQASLDYVFIDGWADFGNTQEGDDFASVWQLSTPYRYIAVYSDFTDPIVGDGFKSFDNELDAIGRFLNDVGQPCPTCTKISINDVLQNEGNSGTTDFNFTITRSGNLTDTSSVQFATAPGTATAATDYVSSSGTVNFAAGEANKTFTVLVNGDTSVEPNETFNVNLSSCIGCAISDNQSVGTIVNDDATPGDIDNDGVPDNIDQCQTVPGPASNNGCPVGQEIVGGEILGIDMTSLFVAGAFANAGWITALGGLVAGGLLSIIARKLVSIRFDRHQKP